MVKKAKATVHGAVSIVNAIATGKGATMGVSLSVEAIVESRPGGKGITFENRPPSASPRFIKKVVEKCVSEKDLQENQINVEISSEIPTGYGLKSSSAISSAISLACSKIFKPQINDKEILRKGVEASIEAKVSITGAYDDACACYYGGFMVTDNFAQRIIRSAKAPDDLFVVIFIPASRKRGNVKRLKLLRDVFTIAWNLARKGEYWNAMLVNGLTASSILNSEPKIIAELLEKGAIAASVSGNGPAIAAITNKTNLSNIKKVFSNNYTGRVVTTTVNNRKAEVHEVQS